MKPAREPNVFCYNSWRVFDIPFGIYFWIKNSTDMQVGGWKWKFTLYHYSWSLNPQKVLCWKRRTYIPILRINNTAGIYHQKLTNLALLMSHAIICSLLVRVTEASFSRVLGSIKKTSPRDTGLLHYQKPQICRVFLCLPSVFFRALDKQVLCRVLR